MSKRLYVYVNNVRDAGVSCRGILARRRLRLQVFNHRTNIVELKARRGRRIIRSAALVTCWNNVVRYEAVSDESAHVSFLQSGWAGDRYRGEEDHGQDYILTEMQCQQ